MTAEVTGRTRVMLSSKVFTERADKARENRTEERRLGVQPAVLADKGNPRGVTIVYYGKLMVLTEAAAITLANGINDALEMEIDAQSAPQQPKPQQVPQLCHASRSASLHAADGTPEEPLPASIAE